MRRAGGQDGVGALYKTCFWRNMRVVNLLRRIKYLYCAQCRCSLDKSFFWASGGDNQCCKVSRKLSTFDDLTLSYSDVHFKGTASPGRRLTHLVKPLTLLQKVVGRLYVWVDQLANNRISPRHCLIRDHKHLRRVA